MSMYYLIGIVMVIIANLGFLRAVLAQYNDTIDNYIRSAIKDFAKDKS